MQGARPCQRGGQNGDTPNHVGDTVRLAGSKIETAFLFLGRCRAVSLKGYMYQVV